MAEVIPRKKFKNGLSVDTRSFTWTIENFKTIMSKDSLINSQRLDFNGDDSKGRSYLRTVFLQRATDGERRSIRIHYELEDCTPGDLYCIKFKAAHDYDADENDDDEYEYEYRHRDRFWTAESEVREVSAFAEDKSGFLIDPYTYTDSHLVIDITFKLYCNYNPYLPTQLEPVKPTLEEFQAKFAVKLRKDLADLLQNPSNDIKIVANDEKEFTAHRAILAVRSPVFAAMFQSNMIETNHGVLKLPDISSTTLQVLLTFIYTGEVHPDWKLNNVLLELTNAAAKYELPDLLAFLDAMMGKVCDLQNVVPLYTLASKLSLETAKKELMTFVKEEGTRTTNNFDEFLANVVSSSF